MYGVISAGVAMFAMGAALVVHLLATGEVPPIGPRDVWMAWGLSLALGTILFSSGRRREES